MRASPLHRDRWAAAAVGLAAALIGMAGSWIPSIWGDEAASLLSAERPVASLLREVAHVDAVHALYYLLLHGWIEVFGTSPFALRLPSALAVGVACAGVVELGRRLVSLPFGITAGLVAAVLPRTTYMGEEARSSALATAVAVWLTVLLVILLERRRRWDPLWIAYGALLVVGVHLFVYLALVALAHGIVVLRRGRACVRGWLLTGAASVVACVPIVLAVLGQHAQLDWLASLDRAGFVPVAVELWFGDAAVAVIAWLLIAAAVVLAVRDRVMGSVGSRGRVVAIALPWLLVPVVVLEIVNRYTPAFTPRYLSMCTPAAALLMTVPLAALATRRRALAVAAGAALLVAAAPVWVAQRTPFAKDQSDWAEISATIGADARAGDGILFDESTSPSHRTRLAMYAYPAGFRKVDDVDLREPFFETTSWHDSTLSVPALAADGRLAGLDRLWLVEYRPRDRVPDAYGERQLEALGFHVARTIDEHTSEVILLTRA